MRTSMRLGLLALAAVLVATFLASPALAKGGGGGGGHAGGGGRALGGGGGAARGDNGGHESGAAAEGGGGAVKPSGSKEADTPASSKEAGTGYEAPPQAVGSRSNPYYGYPGYGLSHHNLSNFFLWYWLFHPHHRCDRDNDNEATQSGNQSSGETAHERCDFDYQYRYGGEPNYGVGGWAVLAMVGTAVVGVFFVLKKRPGLVSGK